MRVTNLGLCTRRGLQIKSATEKREVKAQRKSLFNPKKILIEKNETGFSKQTLAIRNRFLQFKVGTERPRDPWRFLLARKNYKWATKHLADS